MSHDLSNVSTAFGLFARSDFQTLPMEVQGFVAKILGLISASQVDASDLQVPQSVLAQALCFVARAMLESLSPPIDAPAGLSAKPDAVRQRRARARRRADQHPAEVSSVPTESQAKLSDMSQPAVTADEPARDMSRPVPKSAAFADTSTCDVSHDPCLFVNRNIKIQTTNKPSDAREGDTSQPCETVRERQVFEALISHEQLAEVATPQLASLIAQEAPDVDVPMLAGKLAAQFARRKPSINPVGYIRAVFKKQQIQQVQNSCLNKKTSKKQMGETPHTKAKSLPISAGRLEREDLLQPLLVERLPEQVRQEGLLAMRGILAELRAVA